ncbi:hypothetical protein GRI97_07970 [Altererythrobacter xixiisoli]|uniref:ATP-dependent DNA ligase family profile domain-containing protein n=1 Tax=Croceibacterium xixiisoli TaxID=1476466 RepID=A0A6I4TSR0_9SPHN|nr:hypothetical protein [Croceibacterium xixiisoli]MXO98922.1 hypothetical protein [Croceibacterium xixiisoli]
MTGRLCQLATDWRGSVPPFGTMAEEKIDGWRALYLRGHDGTPRLYTRNGRRIEGVAHIVHRLAQLERIAGQPLFIDGELQVDGTLDATKRWCEAGWRMGGDKGVFHAFDCLPLADWRSGGGDAPLTARKAMLVDLIRQADADPSLSWEWRPGSRGADGEASPVRLVDDVWLGDGDDVEREARRVWSAGGEGLMLKDTQAVYRRHRNASWLKVK